MARIRWRTGLRLSLAVLLSVPMLPRAYAASPLDADVHADSVVVLKKERKLILYSQGQVLKAYAVSLGTEPVGPKTHQGDHKTPEGHYILDRRNPKSQYHLSIHISYPTPDQVQNARKRGTSPGGDVFIHGLPNGFGWLGSSQLAADWTDGCISVTNAEMDEIWRVVPDGTPIEIKP
jgi:murein L,D-transpeptidase YafK